MADRVIRATMAMGMVLRVKAGMMICHRASFRAELFGHYMWWNLDSSWKASYDDFIWDFNANKKIHLSEHWTMDLFFSAHNLFNGAQYTQGDSQNPRRWVEAGIRMKF